MKETWFPGHLTTLSEQECRELLAAEEVGRIAWCDPMGPVVFPVNYVMNNGEIHFRTSPRTALAHQLDLGAMTFEIDEFDPFTQSGWSVMVRGRAHYVSPIAADPRDQVSIPWAEGDRTFTVRITPLVVTGRRLSAA